MEFTVKISMIEIYMEKIRDLLDPSKDNLKVHEEKSKGVYVADVTETYVGDETEVYAVMRLGNSNRSIAATNMNAESSRSHSIFILTVTQTNMEDLSVKTGKLYLVDLAGSEKISKTGATGTTLDEAKMINKSLTTLGKVITALTDKKATHIPYRESKLTRIL
jgi:kinesin family protein 5